MSTTAPTPVAIVGAGPTGITAACLLARAGVASVVLERWAGVYPQPRAVHLDDEVCRILDRVGVLEEFLARSRPALGLQLLDAEHRVLARIDRSGASPSSGHPRANMFDQPDLEQLLREQAARSPLIEIRGECQVTGIEQIGEQVVVRYQDLATGRREQVDADYLLGCDGANSVVRAAIGSAYDDLGFEQRWLVVDVETTAELDQWEGVHQVCDPTRAATFMRVGTTRYRWEFQLLDHESSTDYADLAALQPLIAPWTARVASVDSVDGVDGVDGADGADLRLVRVAEYTFRAQIADRLRSGRVFLLGDAAHLTPPFIGQGLGAGLRDAANLSWKLAEVHHGRLGEEALDTYAAERKPHARAMIDLARITGVLMTSGGRLGALLRRALLPVIVRLPVARSRMVDSATPRLRRSWLIERRPRLAGALVPNSDVGAQRLDHLLGVQWALITRAPLPTDVQADLEGRGCVVVRVTTEDRLGRWLAAGRVSAALVRPDRTVASAHREVGVLSAQAQRLLQVQRDSVAG